MYSFLIKFN